MTLTSLRPHEFTRLACHALAAFAVAVGIAPGCSSSDSGGSSGPTLPTDSHTLCVPPSTSPQDVTLPTTGTIGGTLSLGAFPVGATGCLGIKIETGGDLQSTSSTQAVHPLASTSAKPIATFTVGEAFGNNGLFDQVTITNGMVLNAPTVNFPDGTYYMTIRKETLDGVRVQTIMLTATNGTMTVAPLKTDGVFGTSGKNSQFPQLIFAKTTATLTLYPVGVVPPAADDVESTTPKQKDVSKDGLPALPTDPVPTSPSSPDAHGLPPPAVGAAIGYTKVVWPPPGCTGNPGCSEIRPIVSEGGSTTPLDALAGMTGTITFEMAIAYMQIQSAFIDCPSDWEVTAGLNGSGSITIPDTHPNTNATCTITYSTVPPGGGSGYEFEVGLRGLDIGAH